LAHKSSIKILINIGPKVEPVALLTALGKGEGEQQKIWISNFGTN
jgi:hypothetical protein